MSGFPSYRVPGAPHCPQCRELLDGATKTLGNGRQPPGEGCLTVCIYCAEILVFTAENSFRLVGAEELAALPRKVRDHLALLRTAIRSFAQHRRSVKAGQN